MVRAHCLLVGVLWATLPAFAIEPQAILEQTNNLRPEVLELALEARFSRSSTTSCRPFSNACG
jgi:hypothetical protein